MSDSCGNVYSDLTSRELSYLELSNLELSILSTRGDRRVKNLFVLTSYLRLL